MSYPKKKETGTHMNAVAAFENRKDKLRAQLEESENMPQAISAATMTLEQIACDLAQDEQDDFARQRQQAVMALAKRLPLGLRASRAKAQIVLEETQEQPSRVRRGAVGAGAVMLAALAVYEAVNGKMNFALLQALGALLMLFGTNGALTATTRQIPRAQAETAIDAADMVREVGEICQAADLCAADLALIEQDNAPSRLSGTADEAMLDLLGDDGRRAPPGGRIWRCAALTRREQYLRMLGVQSVFTTRSTWRCSTCCPPEAASGRFARRWCATGSWCAAAWRRSRRWPRRRREHDWALIWATARAP